MDPSLAQPDHTSSIGQLSAQFADQKRAKSPPLAFEPTSNDSLAAPIHPDSNIPSPKRGATSSMGRFSPSRQSGEQGESRNIIDQQTLVINRLHEAFAEERKMWDLERTRLYNRIANLETLLLRAGGSYSPAKSPILSPLGVDMTSPSTRATSGSNRLPSIAEDENSDPLSARRDGVPQSIDLPTITNDSFDRRSSVNFAEATPTSVKVEEIPTSPAPTNQTLSPPPFSYRVEAGHTPLRGPRPATPPPKNSMSMDGIDDTPTRNNTHINTLLTQSNDDDSGKGLTGPLNMPELPHVPSEANFTFDMLSKRLEQIEQHPEQSEAKPFVFKQPSPGLASPAEDEYEFSPKTVDPHAHERPSAPPATRAFAPQDSSMSEIPSNALSKQTSHDDQVQAEFESGGIKLKKKPSVNFGAPFGQLGGFGSRKQS
ncbi:uncharacterized protein LTR77_001906 [Saxophila tyrrhenica]|uniref:Uncharacterized protein n=1 Tax=Saxophila tyrrhenica TaxID=1690608 RepID=A0AAV9PLR9_9PEZI|nr:hypothetical protein LTR77_001906 [Saxophila tyrrhenica]